MKLMRHILARPSRFFVLAVAVLFLAAGPAALAQPPQAPAKQQPPKRAKKVWTNDDLEVLRTPSDTYLRDKERLEDEARRARETEEAARKAAAEKGEASAASSEVSGAEAGKPAVIPTTLPELEKRYNELTEKIASLERQIAVIEEELLGGDEELRGSAAERKDAVEKELEKTREEFYTVRDRRNALRRRP